MKREERITERLSQDMNDLSQMDRRDFFRKLGGGIVIAFSVSELGVLASVNNQPAEERAVNTYLHINEDGRVKLYTGKIEMGQGPITSLPMMLADELDVSLDAVDIIMGDTDLCPWDEGTYGSLSTRAYGQVMRGAAAEAKAILLKMAAGELDTEVSHLQVDKGVISMKSDPGKKISYAELTKGKDIMETIKETPGLKKAKDMKIMGTSRLHVDAELKVTGKAIYSGDLQLPGMMYAKVLRPPSLGAKMTGLDTSRAEAIEGTEIVREDDFVAILHPSQDMADVAIARVKAEWEEQSLDVDHESLYNYLVEKGTEANQMGDGKGNTEKGMAESAKTFTSEFKDPYLAHAPIENHTASAVFEGEKLNIWASCQTPYPTKENVAETLGIPEENVRLREIFTGGGFGGKIYNPQVIEAARIAKLSGKPVQLVYTREEEFMFDRLRPAAVVQLDSGITEEGRIHTWDYKIYFGGGRGARHFYDIPNHRTRGHRNPRGSRGHIFYTGAWRGPSNNTNTWARESQIEMMAAAAGKDAVKFRLEHLEGNPKMVRTLMEGAEAFGWIETPGPGSRESANGSVGRGMGVALAIDAGTYVALFAEVEVDKSTGEVQVLRVTVSQDMGLVVNPQGAIIQAEGGVLMGLGYCFTEEIEFESRKMLSRNFDSYGITRFSWTPEINVHFVDKQDEPPQGGGEPSIVAMGGAVANAIYDACGARLFRQPMTPERVLEAIKNSKETIKWSP